MLNAHSPSSVIIVYLSMQLAHNGRWTICSQIAPFAMGDAICNGWIVCERDGVAQSHMIKSVHNHKCTEGTHANARLFRNIGLGEFSVAQFASLPAKHFTFETSSPKTKRKLTKSFQSDVLTHKRTRMRSELVSIGHFFGSSESWNSQANHFSLTNLRPLRLTLNGWNEHRHKSTVRFNSRRMECKNK